MLFKRRRCLTLNNMSCKEMYLRNSTCVTCESLCFGFTSYCWWNLPLVTLRDRLQEKQWKHLLDNAQVHFADWLLLHQFRFSQAFKHAASLTDVTFAFSSWNSPAKHFQRAISVLALKILLSSGSACLLRWIKKSNGSFRSNQSLSLILYVPLFP